MTDNQFKILYSFSSTFNNYENYIMEIKRLDLPSDSPLKQKFRWLLLNTNDIISLEFISMKKFTSNDDEVIKAEVNEKSGVHEEVQVSNENIEWSEYREFKQGDFYFNTEKAVFCYYHKDNLNELYQSSELALPTTESFDKIQYIVCPTISINLSILERIKVFLKSS